MERDELLRIGKSRFAAFLRKKHQGGEQDDEQQQQQQQHDVVAQQEVEEDQPFSSSTSSPLPSSSPPPSSSHLPLNNHNHENGFVARSRINTPLSLPLPLPYHSPSHSPSRSSHDALQHHGDALLFGEHFAPSLSSPPPPSSSSMPVAADSLPISGGDSNEGEVLVNSHHVEELLQEREKLSETITHLNERADTFRQENEKLSSLNDNLCAQLQKQGDELAVLREDNTRLIQEFDALMHDDHQHTRSAATKERTAGNEMQLSIFSNRVQERVQQLIQLSSTNEKLSDHTKELLLKMESYIREQSSESTKSDTNEKELTRLREVTELLSKKNNVEIDILKQLNTMLELTDPVNLALNPAGDAFKYSANVNGDIMGTLKTLEQENRALREDIESEKQRNASIINQNIALQRRAEEITQEKQMHLSSLQQSLNDLSLERLTIKQELVNANQAVQQYQQLASGKEDELGVVSNRLKERELEVKSLEEKVAILETQLLDHHDSTNALQTDFDVIQSSIDKQQDGLSSLVEDKKLADEKRREFERKNEQLKYERDVLREKLNAATHETDFQPENEKEESQPSDQQPPTYEELTAELRIAKQKVRQLIDDKYYLAQEVDSSSLELDTLAFSVAELEAKLHLKTLKEKSEQPNTAAESEEEKSQPQSQSQSQSQQLGPSSPSSEHLASISRSPHANQQHSNPKPILPHLSAMPASQMKYLIERRPMRTGLGANLKPVMYQHSAFSSLFSYLFASWFQGQSDTSVYRV